MGSVKALLVIMALSTSNIVDSQVKHETSKININLAKKTDILKFLKGVNIEKAKKIVQYRAKNGKIQSFDDLLQVEGMTKRLVEINKEKIVF